MPGLGTRPVASLLDGAIASASIRAAGLVLAVPSVGVALWLLARPPRDDGRPAAAAAETS